jgi:toxin HigB-1
VIKTFADKETEDLFHGNKTNRTKHFPPNIIETTYRKFDILNAATTLQELQNVPGNRLEKLKGMLSGYYSIRINDQWRLIFVWADGNALSVKVTDYH